MGLPIDVSALLDALPDAAIVVGPDGLVTYLNPIALELAGAPAERLIGTAASGLVHSDGPSARVVRPGGVEVSVDRVDVALPSAGGHRLWLLRSAPEPPAQSAAVGIYHQVFHQAPVGLFHFDARGVISACNDRFVDIIGSSRRVLVGLDLTTLPNQGIVACVRETLAGRHAEWDGDYASATSQKVTPVRVHFAPVLDERSQMSAGVGIVEDVTERIAAERALARHERMASLGTLAAGIAHEINNPLTYVVTSIDIAEMRARALRRGDEGPAWDELLEILASAREGAQRVRAIVGDLRTFVRADDGSDGAVEVRPTLESAIKLSWNEIRHRARLVRAFEDVPPIVGSETRVVQVFVNLLVNAAQAIPEGDADHNTITLRTRTWGDHVLVEVEDTGSGIAPEDLDRVFEPFFTRRTGIGTGLGLSIVHGIVESLGGRVAVRSAPGEGTTFTVALPKASGVPAEPESEETGSEHVPGFRILVIDDEARLGETLRLALGAEHEVDYVTSGTAAIERLTADQAYDVVLCDLMLPDKTGPEIYEALSSLPTDVASRFVFMTGGAFTPKSRDFLRSVPNPRLEKPFDIEDVRRVIARVGARSASVA